MGIFRPETILEWVSYVLIEDVVNTTLNLGNGDIVAGLNTVTPGSMLGIYPGAMLVVGIVPALEVVIVISTTASTFTADFGADHAEGDPIVGATFPCGQADGSKLFTQAEMLGYLAEVQNDFLLQVQPIYAILPQTLLTGKRVYDCPSDSIRIERISLDGNELHNATQTDLDWMETSWQNDATNKPRYWYQDKVGNQMFGVGPPPKVGGQAQIFYARRSVTTLELLEQLLVPDVMCHFLKYGVLAKAFDKDGEQRDPARAKYCQNRYSLGVALSVKFLAGVGGRVSKQRETVEPLLAAQGA